MSIVGTYTITEPPNHPWGAVHITKSEQKYWVTIPNQWGPYQLFLDGLLLRASHLPPPPPEPVGEVFLAVRFGQGGKTLRCAFINWTETGAMATTWFYAEK